MSGYTHKRDGDEDDDISHESHGVSARWIHDRVNSAAKGGASKARLKEFADKQNTRSAVASSRASRQEQAAKTGRVYVGGGVGDAKVDKKRSKERAASSRSVAHKAGRAADFAKAASKKESGWDRWKAGKALGGRHGLEDDGGRHEDH
jgi:hypothetical protein